MSLRTDLIKLAHENPELRKDLLPLLKAANTTYGGKTFPVDTNALRAAIQIGDPEDMGWSQHVNVEEIQMAYDKSTRLEVLDIKFKPSIRDCSWEYAGRNGWSFNLVGSVLYEVSLIGQHYQTKQNMKIVSTEHFPLELETYDDLENFLPDEIRRQAEGA